MDEYVKRMGYDRERDIDKVRLDERRSWKGGHNAFPLASFLR